MKTRILRSTIVSLVSFFFTATYAQVGIGTPTPDSSSILDVSSTVKGMLIPRMTQTERDGISGPATGLMIYQTDNTPGLYCNSGTPGIPAWGIVGEGTGYWQSFSNHIYYNAGNVGIGTSAPEAKLHVNGGDALINGLTIGKGGGSIYNNSAFGRYALYLNDDGEYNTAIGFYALLSNQSGGNNTAFGANALVENQDGENNVAVGCDALYFNDANIGSTAIGFCAMKYADNRTSGRETYNTAVGCEALRGSTTVDLNTGRYNTALGSYSLYSNQLGTYNSAMGYRALYSNYAGSRNTASGYLALRSNLEGHQNAALGSDALSQNTSGSDNTAIGAFSLLKNIANSRSTAIGNYALYQADDRTTGRETYNTAVGYSALYGSAVPADNTGQRNTALGDMALYSNTSGDYNTATGTNVLNDNTTGHHNTASGSEALYNNTTGYSNTATGSEALYNNTEGYYNVACGNKSLFQNNTGNYNTAVGFQAGYWKENVDQCTFIGFNTYVSTEDAFNATALGNAARATMSNQVMIGSTGVTWIGGYASWTNLSDSRYKINVQENVSGLDFILKLRPVTYQLDMNGLAADNGEDLELDEDGTLRKKFLSEKEIQSRNDKAAIVYTGFLAQEVEEAAKSTGYDFSGVAVPIDENGFYGLRYAEFVVPLVKAMQEQQVMIKELQRTNEELLQRIEKLEAND